MPNSKTKIERPVENYDARLESERSADERLNWDRLVTEIRAAGVTWIPALLCELVETGYRKKVFKPGGASTFAANHERRLGFSAPAKKEKP